jgi:hypothetical protein
MTINDFHATLAKDVLGSQPSDDDALTLMILLHTHHIWLPRPVFSDRPGVADVAATPDGMPPNLSPRPGLTSRIGSGQTRTIGTGSPAPGRPTRWSKTSLRGGSSASKSSEQMSCATLSSRDWNLRTDAQALLGGLDRQVHRPRDAAPGRAATPRTGLYHLPFHSATELLRHTIGRHLHIFASGSSSASTGKLPP